MELREALDIVLSLAQDNALDVDYTGGPGTSAYTECLRQQDALDKVHELLSLLSEKSG